MSTDSRVAENFQDPAPQSAISDSASSPLVVTCSPDLSHWLLEQQLSLAVTTYRSSRLFLLGVKPDGTLSTLERRFERAMGLWATPERLYVSARHQLWRLDNMLESDDYNGFDRLYVPRVGYMYHRRSECA
jgi:protein O-GlcNAc transferase